LKSNEIGVKEFIFSGGGSWLRATLKLDAVQRRRGLARLNALQTRDQMILDGAHLRDLEATLARPWSQAAQ